ncbi:hypothetical protein IAQ61_002104, partial [Plenodomus lingam]|uniref:uncharacterized protein n=1 Tax=Leptosphaeria maculans TaxID=5022 RepID=UPI00332CDE24
MFHTWADDSMGSNQEQPALRPTHPHPPLAVSMGEKLKPAGPQLAIEVARQEKVMPGTKGLGFANRRPMPKDDCT